MATTIFADDSAEQAAEYLRLTLDKLSQLNLIPTPINYALLYTYVAGKDVSLNEIIDQLIEQDKGLNQEKAHILFQQNICLHEDEDDTQMRHELLMMMAPIIGSLVDIAGKTAISKRELEDHIHALAKTSNSRETLLIAANILSETRKFVSETQEFESSLSQTTQEISYLKDELEHARKQATIDVLTGLSNRRAFDKALIDAMQATDEDDEIFCLMIIDIDHFKQFNDDHGHLVGDKVLIGVAREMMRNMRGGDFLARLGGEEFAVILRETPITGAFTVSENLRRSIERLKLKHVKSRELIENVTVSIGVANFRRGESEVEFIARCDEALYRAKSHGRNRTVIAD